MAQAVGVIPRWRRRLLCVQNRPANRPTEAQPRMAVVAAARPGIAARVSNAAPELRHDPLTLGLGRNRKPRGALFLTLQRLLSGKSWQTHIAHLLGTHRYTRHGRLNEISKLRGCPT